MDSKKLTVELSMVDKVGNVSKQVWISPAAFDYLIQMQVDIQKSSKKRIPLGRLASTAILNGIIEEK
jgi:CRISPR/Cas system-associated endonuclease Cas1